ncbi:MAG: DUF1016 family protein [Bacilli bacterium]|nr:DUF1016 family protein [Bacilli bacterium]
MKQDEYYETIKGEILNNEITKKVKDYSKNRSDLRTYASIGKTLEEAGKHYGEGIIKKYAEKLTKEFGRGYSQRNLRNMRRFSIILKESNWQTMSANLGWSQYCEIIWLEENPRKYYYQIANQKNLSIRELRTRIKNKEYERLDEETKEKIKNDDKQEITDYIKNPIMIQNKNRYEEISEKVLQKIILEDIPSFLEELGAGFTFIRNEYKIKIGDRYNYIDLLLYNIKYRCYVVVELKISELKKEHIGQIEVYMNYIDKNLKSEEEENTIGIILVRKNNKYVMEYCSDERIKTREYLILS